MRVLLLGGTGEARELAAALVATGVGVVSSLAGRVHDPRIPDGELRVGGFGGVEGLVAALVADPVDAVIDATHPFATGITANAADATGRLGLPFLVLRRPGWVPRPGDDWHWADTMADAAAMVGTFGTRVFLSIGRGRLDLFTRDELWYLLRSVDPPRPPLPTHHAVVLGRGPFDVAAERALLREHRIDVIVTRDSGGDHTSAKLTAARELGLPVVVVRRPPLPDVPVVPAVADATRWLAAR
jgi:precorrin-6A/cobalt-precorrin-6A reductase